MSVINAPLLEAVMQAIEADPEHHDQANWRNPNTSCGTTYCYAGWTALLAGKEWSNETSSSVLKNGESVSQFAQKALGISDVEADKLFSGYGDVATVRGRVDTLIAKAKRQQEHILND